MSEGNDTFKVDRLPDVVCYECGRVIVASAYVWYNKVLCAKCGEFYSRWPEKRDKEAAK